MDIKVYEKIFNSINVPILLIKNSSVIKANNKCLNIFNYEKFEKLNQNEIFKNILKELLKHKNKKIYKKFEKDDNNLLFEITLKTVDKSNEIYLIQLNPIEDQNLYQRINNLSTQNREIFDNASEAIVILNNESIVLDINKPFEDLFGFSRKEALGKDIDDLIVPPNEKNEAKKLFNHVLNNEKLNVYKTRVTKNNKEVKVEIINHPITLENDNKANYIIYRDVTEKTKVQNELKEKKAFLNQLFNKAFIPIAFLDKQENIIEVNPMFEETFKYKQENIVGKNINDLIVPKNHQKEAKNYKYEVFNNNTIHRKTQRINKYGEIINVELFGTPVIVNNKINGLFAMYKDIRKEVKNFKKLKEQRAYFKDLFDKSPEAIALLNKDNKIVNINTSFKKLFKYKLEEVKNKSIDDVIVPEKYLDQAQQYTSHVVNKKDSLSKVAIREDKFGNKIHVDILAYPISLNKDSLGIYAIYKDITDRIKKTKKIKHLAYRDKLTSAFNRSKFYIIVDKEIDKFKNKNNYHFSFVLFDVDLFKNINDNYGHHIGDEILKEITYVVDNTKRKKDVFFRWGGDEFVLLCKNTNLKKAQNIGKTLDKSIKNHRFTHAIDVSVSFGCSTFKGDLDQLIIEADKKMYQCKTKKRQ
ncbi:MAG: PAS domain S-box protein [Bacillota bacterium]